MSSQASDIPQLSPVKQALIALDQMRAKVESLEQSRAEPLAIIGMGCRFPDAPDTAAFWQLLRDGRDAVKEVPSWRWNAGQLYDPDPDAPGKMNTRWGGFLDQIDQFDPEFFGISPREAVAMDPQQRLALEVAWEALESSGQGPRVLQSGQTGVFIGVTSDEYAQLFHKAGDLQQFNAYFVSGAARSVIAGRISYVLGLNGPNLSIDTACSSSLVAIHTACLHLRASECRIAIAGGINVVLSPEITMAFSRAHMMAPDGRCKAFDAHADGFVRAEGCGMVVLKRLRDAVADGDHILALIRGSAVNQDGRSSGLTVPNGPAQEAVIRQALANGGVKPEEIDYVEAHGTGTSLGDPIEAHALAAVLGAGRSAERPLVVGSVKTNLGHLESASGVAGLIKVVLSLQHEHIPRHLHFQQMNPQIDWKGMAVEIPVEGRAWPKGEKVRRAGVSSFGFSGTNAHVIVEEAPAHAPRVEGWERPEHILALSARSEKALGEVAEAYRRHLRETPAAVADVCYTANAGRVHFAERLVVSGATAEELMRQLESGGRRARVAARTGVKAAWLFTGQGSQYPGMGRELYATQPVFRATMDRCAELLRNQLTEPLLEVLYGGRGELLDETGYTQPALFALEYALAQMWRSWGLEPSVVLGHSVGEYVAACVAGIYGLEEGLNLIALRGRLMQGLPRGGAMAAVSAPEVLVRKILARVSGVSVAAVNGPSSVVISGHETAVGEVERELGEAGIATQRLVVSHAFHSELMEQVAEEFGRQAAAVPMKAPRVTLISSVTGQALGREEAGSAEYWREQVREAVRFQAAMEELDRRRYAVYMELGPAPVMSGMGQNCVGTEEVYWAPSLRKGRSEWQQILDSLGGLYLRGAEIDWAGFDAGYPRRRVPQPTYPFERQRYWIDLKPSRIASSANTGHPLLGERMVVAGPEGTSIWQTEIGTESIPWLTEHRVHSRMVVPMTAYLEMMSSATAQVATEPLMLRDVLVREPLFIEEGVAVKMQVIARNDTLEVYGRAGDAWKLHASAQIARDTTPQRIELLDDLRRRFRGEVDLNLFYQGLEQRGHDFGPSFRALRSLHADGSEALGSVEPSPAIHIEMGSYRFHPVLLDACMQAIAATLPDSEEQSYMPMGAAEVRLGKGVGTPLWTHVHTLRQADGGALRADIRILDAAGNAVAVIAGLELIRVTPEKLSRASGNPPLGPYFSLAWEEAQEPGIAPAAIRAAADSCTLTGEEQHVLARYEAFTGQLDLLCAAGIMGVLESLGLSRGARGTAAELGRLCGVLSRHERLFGRLLEILLEDRFVRRDGSTWEYIGGDVGTTNWATLRSQFEEFATEMSLVERSMQELGKVLRGAADPLQILFPNGSTEEAAKLYSESPTARVYNSLVARIAERAIERFGQEKPLRVLEIGGGTGGTTAFVAPILPSSRTEYTFTDISPVFTARAAERFGSYGFVRTAVLDIEYDPQQQGFQNAAYEVVLAANVLHATAHLATTLRHAGQLLAPGGLLLMLEVTRRERWIDLTFGMTEGWWRFNDLELRTDYPLLSADRWASFLEECGFHGVSAVRATGDPLNTVLLAGAPERAHVLEGNWLVIGESAAEAVARTIETAGARSTRASAAEAIPALSARNPWRGIVYTAPLDTIEGASEGAGGDRSRNCRPLLELVQALAGVEPSPQLWVITAGAQQVGRSPLVDVTQAPLWGLARTIAVEMPDLDCRLVDLDPDECETTAQRILRELCKADEEQVAWRGDRRHVPRLRACELPETGIPCKLSIGSRGQISNLKVEPAFRREPGEGQIEIAVEAAGLGFRDVLNALDQYPGDPGPLGGDCAGRVVATGPGVTDFRLGEAVVALAPGCHDGYVAAAARLAALRPASLSPELAATIPISFVTAAYTLEELGRIRPGDRVLIHAGAGGVGLAAIQLAKRAGAEIFATAGTEEKRAYLRSLGVRYTFNSRSLDFVTGILEITSGRGVDVVLNSLAGEFVGASFSVLAPGGRFLELGKKDIWTQQQVDALGRDIQYFIVDWSVTARENPALIGGILRRVMQEVEDGRLQALPSTVFGFQNAAAAYRHMAQGRHVGRIVLRQTTGEFPVHSNSTYLIAGGTGGLGLEVAKWLVARGARHLALVARTAPREAVLQAIRELERDGAAVTFMQADIAHPQELNSVFFRMARELPPLRGVIHAAGVLAPALLPQQDWPQFKRALRPKVDGAWNLHLATASLDLDFFVLFSSIASILGSAGQANHAAANAFEDALAHHRRSLGLPALSINWGAWSEVGSAASQELEHRRRSTGLGVFAPTEGIIAFERILRAMPVQVSAAHIDWHTLSAQYRNVPRWMSTAVVQRARSITTAAPVQRSPHHDEQLSGKLSKAPAAVRIRILEDLVHSVAVRVLGFGEGRRIATGQPLHELGLDSLMAVEFRNAISSAVGRSLPVTLLFNYPALDDVTGYLAAEVFGLPQPEQTRVAEPAGGAAAVLGAIEELSDDEVDRLLATRMGVRQ